MLSLAELHRNHKKHAGPIYALLTKRGYFPRKPYCQIPCDVSLSHLHVRDKHHNLGRFPFFRAVHNATDGDLELGGFHMCKALSCSLCRLRFGRGSRGTEGGRRGSVSCNSLLKEENPPKSISTSVSCAFGTCVSHRK